MSKTWPGGVEDDYLFDITGQSWAGDEISRWINGLNKSIPAL